MNKKGLMGVQAALKALQQALEEIGGDGIIEVAASPKDIAAIKATATDLAKWPADLSYMSDKDHIVIASVSIRPRS